MRNLVQVLILIAVLCLPVVTQTAAEMKTAGDAERAAVAAYRAKDHAEFLRQIEIANINRPNHSRLIYNQAIAYALNGHKNDAFNSLERLAKMGIGLAFDRNDDLEKLRDDERFQSIMAAVAENLKPLNASSRAFQLRDRSMIAESVAYDDRSNMFYVGSIHQRRIVNVDARGVETEFSTVNDGLFAVLGMKVDSKRGVLWVATSSIPQMRGFKEADKGRSGIFKYDLRTRSLVKKYVVPAGEQHMLGDLWLDGSGNVYSTDSVSPGIYRIDALKDAIEPFITSDLFASLQGITGGAKENTIYVADYAKGIFRIDIKSKAITQVRPDVNVTLLGIDGLYFHRGSLIAIQNGIIPNRVAAFEIDGDRITSTKVLEANHPDFLEPTLGVISGDNFYFVANSQWPLVNEKAELQIEKLRQPVILKLNLKRFGL